MFTALNENNAIVLARTGIEQGLYYCRSCGNRVCAKIGTGSRTPHFSHIHAPCGDTWADYKKGNSMSQWHIDHQAMYPKEAREVTLYQSGDWYRNGLDSLPVRHTEKPGDLPDGVEYHRADIYMNGLVVEYQISRLPFDEIIKRERFYVNMVWVVESNRYYTDSHWSRSNKPVWVNDGDYMIPSIKDGVDARLTILEFVECVKGNTLPNKITHPMQKKVRHSKAIYSLPTTTYSLPTTTHLNYRTERWTQDFTRGSVCKFEEGVGTYTPPKGSWERELDKVLYYISKRKLPKSIVFSDGQKATDVESCLRKYTFIAIAMDGNPKYQYCIDKIKEIAESTIP